MEGFIGDSMIDIDDVQGNCKLSETKFLLESGAATEADIEGVIDREGEVWLGDARSRRGKVGG